MATKMYRGNMKSLALTVRLIAQLIHERVPVRSLCAALLFFLIAMIVPVSAKLTPWPLDRFVSNSVLIVISRIDGIEPTGITKRGFEELRVRIAIERVLKGHAESEAAFYTLRSAPEFPRFEVGQECLLFISHHDGKLWITQGANGKVIVDGDRVRDVYMVGEAETQALEAFLKKIEQMVAQRDR